MVFQKNDIIYMTQMIANVKTKGLCMLEESEPIKLCGSYGKTAMK